MEEGNIYKHLASDDEEFQEEIGHMVIFENPASPGASTGPSRGATPEPRRDKSDLSDSDYDAETIKDSPRSTDTTLELPDDYEVDGATGVPNLQCHEKLESSDTSVVVKGSDDSTEAHDISPNESKIILNVDERQFLFSPCYKRLKIQAEEAEEEL